VLIYFLKGSLPWQGLKGSTKKEKYERIMEKKIATSIETLCKDCPGIPTQKMIYENRGVCNLFKLLQKSQI